MLSERQIDLLSAIIKEHLESSEPVGSVEVVEKYNFRCSPATIRNEMAKLIDLGYLEMFHTSSGRIPTKLAYKLYLEDILEEEEIPVLQEVAIKQRLWPSRMDMSKMMREATLSLAEATGNMAIVTLSEGLVMSAGAANILDNKEFAEDTEMTRTALTLLDHYDILENIFRKGAFGEDIRFLIGDEIGIDKLDRCTFIFSPISMGNKTGHIAVFGPARMHYPTVVPAVKYTKKLLQELGGAW